MDEIKDASANLIQTEGKFKKFVNETNKSLEILTICLFLMLSWSVASDAPRTETYAEVMSIFLASGGRIAVRGLAQILVPEQNLKQVS